MNGRIRVDFLGPFDGFGLRVFDSACPFRVWLSDCVVAFVAAFNEERFVFHGDDEFDVGGCLRL